jgi:type IV pilus assembly protein PilN
VITKEGEVNIRLRVGGDRDKAVELVRNLETSSRFVAPRLASEAAQTQEGSRGSGGPQIAPGTVEFDILSRYNPLPDEVKKGQDGKKDAVRSGKVVDPLTGVTGTPKERVIDKGGNPPASTEANRTLGLPKALHPKGGAR